MSDYREIEEIEPVTEALQRAFSSDCMHREVYASTNIYGEAKQLAERGSSWMEEYDSLVLEGHDAESILLAQVAGTEIKCEYEPSMASQLATAARHPVKAFYGESLFEDEAFLDYTVWQKGCILERRDVE